jgi:hypothetical protein
VFIFTFTKNSKKMMIKRTRAKHKQIEEAASLEVGE